MLDIDVLGVKPSGLRTSEKGGRCILGLVDDAGISGIFDKDVVHTKGRTDTATWELSHIIESGSTGSADVFIVRISCKVAKLYGSSGSIDGLGFVRNNSEFHSGNFVLFVEVSKVSISRNLIKCEVLSFNVIRRSDRKRIKSHKSFEAINGGGFSADVCASAVVLSNHSLSSGDIFTAIGHV